MGPQRGQDAGENSGLVEDSEDFMENDKKKMWHRKQVTSKYRQTSWKNIKIFLGQNNVHGILLMKGCALKFFFEMVSLKTWLNKQIARMRVKYNSQQYADNTTKTECMTFIGFFLLE